MPVIPVMPIYTERQNQRWCSKGLYWFIPLPFTQGVNVLLWGHMHPRYALHTTLLRPMSIPVQYSEVQCTMGNVHMPPPQTEWRTDTTESITFRQFRWQAVTTNFTQEWLHSCDFQCWCHVDDDLRNLLHPILGTSQQLSSPMFILTSTQIEHSLFKQLPFTLERQGKFQFCQVAKFSDSFTKLVSSATASPYLLSKISLFFPAASTNESSGSSDCHQSTVLDSWMQFGTFQQFCE